MSKLSDFIPKGIENAVSMDELAVRLNTDKRTVRQMIYKARCNGEVICSSCESDNNGYYIPLSKEEAERYYRQQCSRITSATLALQSTADFIGGVEE